MSEMLGKRLDTVELVDRFTCECCGHPLLEGALIDTLLFVESLRVPVTTASVVEQFGLSSPAASNRLRLLFQKGWLERQSESLGGERDPGGRRFVYWTVWKGRSDRV